MKRIPKGKKLIQQLNTSVETQENKNDISESDIEEMISLQNVMKISMNFESNAIDNWTRTYVLRQKDIMSVEKDLANVFNNWPFYQQSG